jgi:hypothetical protein
MSDIQDLADNDLACEIGGKTVQLTFRNHGIRYINQKHGSMKALNAILADKAAVEAFSDKVQEAMIDLIYSCTLKKGQEVDRDDLYDLTMPELADLCGKAMDAIKANSAVPQKPQTVKPIKKI